MGAAVIAKLAGGGNGVLGTFLLSEVRSEAAANCAALAIAAIAAASSRSLVFSCSR